MENNNKTLEQKLQGFKITSPMKAPKTKIERVSFLLNIATLLGVFEVWMFDNLMDKYERQPLFFEYIEEKISCMIWEKRDIEETKEQFLLSIKSTGFVDEFKRIKLQLKT